MGSRSKYPPEIMDLCLTLSHEKGWGYGKIAQHLFHHKGVKNRNDPTRPVSEATVMRWIGRASKQLKGERLYRSDLAWMSANLRLDALREKLFEMVENDEVIEVKDKFEWFRLALAYLQEQSKTNGVYPDKRKQVEHVGQVELLGVDRKELDPRREVNLADFEAWLARESEAS